MEILVSTFCTPGFCHTHTRISLTSMALCNVECLRGSEGVPVLVSVGAVGRWAAVGSVATVAKVRCNTSYCQHQQHLHTSTSAGTHLITVHWCSTHPDQTAGDRNYLFFLYLRQYLILQRWQWPWPVWPLQGVQCACSSTAAAHHYNNFWQNKWPSFVFLANMASRCSHALYLLSSFYFYTLASNSLLAQNNIYKYQSMDIMRVVVFRKF